MKHSVISQIIAGIAIWGMLFSCAYLALALPDGREYPHVEAVK